MRLLFLLLLTALCLPATAQIPTTLLSPNPVADAEFGFAVAGVPDANGDGHGDLLIGAYRENGGVTGAGRAYLYSGATGTLIHTLESPNVQSNGFFGLSVAGVPDVNGDGRGELLVGTHNENVGSIAFAGRAYLYDGATGAVLRTLESPNAESAGRFGISVAGVPDANGDDHGDLLVGAYLEDGGAGAAGRTYLFSGATGVLLHTLESPTPTIGGSFGHSVAGVPDTDGDGRGDLLIAAIEEVVDGADDAGRAYLVSGATGAFLHTLESPNAEEDGFFGVTVGGVPDADGDGMGDLIIGTRGEDGGMTNTGRAYLYTGATGALLRTLESPNVEENGRFGSVAGVPDTNGDGRGDLLVGARGETRPGTSVGVFIEEAGRAYLYLGTTATTALAGTEGWRLLAAPVATSVQDLVSGIYTQGAGGATTSDGGTNVLRYDEPVAGDRDLGFTAVPDLRTGAIAGRGYAVYVYADDDPITGGVQGGFPKTLSTIGVDYTSSDVAFPITFTATDAVQEDGWNLVGNPYDASLDWDVAGWVKANVDNTIYVYDPIAGVYKTWNGTAGSLGDGLADAFQGFWVKAFAPAPQLIAPAAARTTETTPIETSTALGLAVDGTVDGQTVRDELFVTFHDDALVGLDAHDAYELVPFRTHYAALYALADGTAVDISTLPPGEDVIEIPLDVAAVADGAFAGGAMTLSWPDLSALPSSWRLTITDTRENTTVDLRSESSYAFSVASSSRQARNVMKGRVAHETPPVPTPLFDAEASEHQRSAGTRFVLRLDASASVASEDRQLEGFGISSVRPNPLGGRGMVVAHLNVGGPARLVLHDALGREAAVLIDGMVPAGRHEVSFDPAALGLAPGVYVIRWQAGQRSDAQTITLLR